MSKQDLTKKYLDLVRKEEQRIKKMMTRKFSYLRSDMNNFSTDILLSRRAYREEYNYLRQRYYRLRKLDERVMEQRMRSYIFDDYVAGIEAILNRLGIRNEVKYEKLLNDLRSMTRKEKQRFVEEGYILGLREEYEEAKKEMTGEDTIFTEHLYFRMNAVKSKK